MHLQVLATLAFTSLWYPPAGITPLLTVPVGMDVDGQGRVRSGGSSGAARARPSLKEQCVAPPTKCLCGQVLALPPQPEVPVCDDVGSTTTFDINTGTGTGGTGSSTGTAGVRAAIHSKTKKAQRATKVAAEPAERARHSVSEPTDGPKAPLGCGCEGFHVDPSELLGGFSPASLIACSAVHVAAAGANPSSPSSHSPKAASDVEDLEGPTRVAEHEGLLATAVASAGVVVAALPEVPSRATTAVPETLLHSLAAAPVGANVARQAKDAAARMYVRWSWDARTSSCFGAALNSAAVWHSPLPCCSSVCSLARPRPLYLFAVDARIAALMHAARLLQCSPSA
jgi:hypothetical protein